MEHETHERCPQCFFAMMQPISFKSAPNVLIFEINSRNIKRNKTLKFEWEGETVVLDVRGHTMETSILHLVLFELMVMYGTMMV